MGPAQAGGGLERARARRRCWASRWVWRKALRASARHCWGLPRARFCHAAQDIFWARAILICARAWGLAGAGCFTAGMGIGSFSGARGGPPAWGRGAVVVGVQGRRAQAREVEIASQATAVSLGWRD